MASARRLKFAARAAIGLAGLLLIARLALLRGVFLPVRVTGGSMAETLRGEHRVVICPDCGHSFSIGIEYAAEESEFVCRNCGDSFAVQQLPSWVLGDRVLLDLWPALVSRFRRWDVVAAQLPGEGGELTVKRVLGLPGERITLDGGDLFVDGERARKSLARFREMSILVHDDQHRPRSRRAPPAHWRGESSPSGWEPMEDGYRFPSASSASEGVTVAGFDWLGYHHFAVIPHPSPPRRRDEEVPILDDYSYDPALPRRPLHRVDDLLVESEILVQGAGEIAWRAWTRHGDVRLELRLPSGGWKAVRDGQVIASGTEKQVASGSRIRVEFGQYDGQLIWTVRRRTIVAVAIDDRVTRPSTLPHPAPLAIGAAGRVSIELRQLRVYRDLYYLSPLGEDQPWSRGVLGPDEFFLVGDNSPRSLDSRRWQPGSITSKSLLGRVLRPPL